MYGQINDTKHTKTFSSRPFANSLDSWSVGDLYFFAHGAYESVGKKIFFMLRGWKKKFLHQFWWVGRETGRETGNKTIVFRPYILLLLLHVYESFYERGEISAKKYLRKKLSWILDFKVNLNRQTFDHL